MSNTRPLRALHLENTELKNEIRTLRRQITELRKAIRALNMLEEELTQLKADFNVFDLLNDILRSALAAVDSENGSLLLLDEETKELVFAAVASEDEVLLPGQRIPMETGIVGRTVKTRTPRLVADVRHDPDWSPLVDELTGFRTLSLMCVPLIVENRVLGALEVVNTRSGDPFDEDDMDVMVLVARLASMAIVRAEVLAE